MRGPVLNRTYLTKSIYGLTFWVVCLLAPPTLAQSVSFSVVGAGEQLTTDLKDASETHRLVLEGTSDPNMLMAAAHADFTTLLGVLYKNARYGPRINLRVNGRPLASYSPFSTPSRITQIDIAISAGPEFAFGRVAAGPLASQTELPEGFSSGQAAKSTVVQDAALAAVEGWRDQGYAFADVRTQTISADHRTARLNAELDIETGPILRFAQLTVSGSEGVRPDRIREIAGLPTGATYSPAAMKRAGARLRNTGAFYSVTLRHSESANPDGTLDVTAQLSDAPLRRFGAGAEVESDKGLQFGAFWTHRNLLGGAENLRIDGKIEEVGGIQSGVDFSLSANFRRPGTFAPDIDLIARLALERDDGVSSLSNSFSAYLGLERQIANDLTGELGIDFMLEERDLRPGRDAFRVLSFPSVIGLDTRDDLLNPADGALARLELRPYLGGLDAGSGLRAFADLRGYHAISSNIILAGRLQFGSVAGSSISATPSDYLFLSGGSGTVRGQPYQNLGTSASGSFTGGRSFLAASLEARLGVTDAISLVGFYDQGFVGPDSMPSAAGSSHSGYGLGARYLTAIGPIRLDVGLPAQGATGPKVYLGIGQAF